MMNTDGPYSHLEADDEENYFVSMTDMMVGMLFIFILMLMYYALQVRIIVDGATSTQDTRVQIIKDIVKEVRAGGVEVEEDAANGIIRLKNNVVFGSGESDVSPTGVNALNILAAAILQHTQCHVFTPGDGPAPGVCRGRRHVIDAIFVEGHTDSDPIRTARLSDNWDLSVARSTNTYRVMMDAEPALRLMRNAPLNMPNSESVMSVAGYAAERPVVGGDTEEAKALNRRIDIRITMRPPEAPRLVAQPAVERMATDIANDLPAGGSR